MKTGFKDYCLAFYGQDGLYPSFLPDLSEEELDKAISERIDFKGLDFCGDSYDREIVRDLMFYYRGSKLSSLEHQNIVGKILYEQSIR